MKIVITETTDERPGADVDDGFASQRQNPSSQKIQVKLKRGRRLLGMASSRRVRVASPGLLCVRVAPPGLLCVRAAPPGSKRLDQHSSGAFAKPIGEAQHHRIKQYNARTEPELTESTGESGTNTTAATTVTRSGQC